MNRRTLSALAGCALLLASAALPLAAQTAETAQWSIVFVSEVRPGSGQDYEAYQKEVSAAYKKAGVPYRAVLQTVLGNVNQYISVTPLSKFAAMDGPGPLVKALGEEGAARLRQRGASMTTSMHRFASRSVPGLAVRTKTEQPAPFAMLTYYNLAMGRGEEFDALFKSDYLPVVKKADIANFWVSQPVHGGNPNQRVSVRLMSKLGEFDDGPFARRVLGDEGYRKLVSKMAPMIQDVRYEVLRYRADLSYEAPPPTTSSASAR